MLGQVVVENRGGAGGNLGADVVAKGEKDGYTLLLGAASILCANKFLYRRSMPFEPLRDLAPVTRVTTGTVLLVVNAERPWKTFGELIAAAKARPGAPHHGLLRDGHGQPPDDREGEKERRYRHHPRALPGRRAGDPGPAQRLHRHDVRRHARAHAALREGRFRAFAVGSAERVGYVPELRDVPGMKELLPDAGIDMQSWYAIVAPAGLAATVLGGCTGLPPSRKLDEFRGRIEPTGFTPVTDATPGDFGAYLRAQEAVWKELVELSGATPD